MEQGSRGLCRCADLVALAAWPSERHAQTASGSHTPHPFDCAAATHRLDRGLRCAAPGQAPRDRHSPSGRGTWVRAQHVTRVALAGLVANREGLAFWEHQGFAPVRMLLSREVESARRRIRDFSWALRLVWDSGSGWAMAALSCSFH